MTAITRACFASIAAVSVFALMPSTGAFAQDAARPARAASPPAAPARATDTPTVITIDRANLSAEPPVVDAAAADARAAGTQLAAPFFPGGAGARPGTAGQLAAPPPGRLNVTLTPRQPAAENRAYLNYTYPNTVHLSKDTAYARYTSANMPGFFGYTAHVKQGSRYLIEIDVRTDNAVSLAHMIGGNQTIHAISSGNNPPISAIVMPSADGWISGGLMQSNSNAGSWEVHSVKIREID